VAGVALRRPEFALTRLPPVSDRQHASPRPNVNVLISSAGRRVVLARLFRNALAETGTSGAVLAADASPLSATYTEAAGRFIVPRCTAPDFVPTLLAECRKRNIDLIIPTIDTELPILAAARCRLSG